MATVQVQEPQRLLIGGEWVDADSGRRWESSGPVEGEPSSSVAAAGREDVRRAVEAAAAAFPEWSRSAPGRASLAAQRGGGAARGAGGGDRRA